MKDRNFHPARVAAMLLVAIAIVSVGSQAGEWEVKSAKEHSMIKFGYLVQGRLEATDTSDGSDTSKDLYFRRLRLLAGGKLTEKWSFFMETDSPNLGKGTSTGKPNGATRKQDLYIQDFVLTYNHSNAFKLDMGMLLIPMSHNSTQSAVSLMPHDYGPYSFLESAPSDSNVGRDYGVLARGHVADDHLEYRVGVFQGNRGTDSTEDFRYVGRLVYYPFEAEKGLFYSGTTLGKKKIVAIGASIDQQDEYQSHAADVYVSWPVNDGDGVTFQADWIHYDGDVTYPTLAEQDALLIEAGYYFASKKLQPFIQYAERDFESEETADLDKTSIGLAWHIRGHNMALKFAWVQLGVDGGIDRDQYVVQLQTFVF